MKVLKLGFSILLLLSLMLVLFWDNFKDFFRVNEKIKFLKGHPLRDCDAFGCGNFGASRGNRTHKGLDLRYEPNELVNAPFDCYINRIGRPYHDDNNYFLVEIVGVNEFKNYKAKLMYVTTTFRPNPNVIFKQGQPIGRAQNISAKYGQAMVNHVHFEMYSPNQELINPEIYA